MDVGLLVELVLPVINSWFDSFHMFCSSRNARRIGCSPHPIASPIHSSFFQHMGATIMPTSWRLWSNIESCFHKASAKLFYVESTSSSVSTLWLHHIIIITYLTSSSNITPYSLAVEKVNLAREYPQWFFADYASKDLPHQESGWCQAGIIEHFEKMACFHGNHCQNRKLLKVKYLGTYSRDFHNIGFWTYVLEHDLSNGVMTLKFQGQLIAKIKIQHKKTHLHGK